MNCVKCGSPDTKFRGVENDYHLPPIEIWDCRSCGTTFDADHKPEILSELLTMAEELEMWDDLKKLKKI